MGFKSIVEKTENAGYQHFLLFPQCFLILDMYTYLTFWVIFDICRGFQFGYIC